MYEQCADKIFIVDYFIYNNSNSQRKIHTLLLGSTSRKAAEYATRELEKNSKITIVKIQSLNSNDINNIIEEDSSYL